MKNDFDSYTIINFQYCNNKYTLFFIDPLYLSYFCS